MLKVIVLMLFCCSGTAFGQDATTLCPGTYAGNIRISVISTETLSLNPDSSFRYGISATCGMLSAWAAGQWRISGDTVYLIYRPYPKDPDPEPIAPGDTSMASLFQRLPALHNDYMDLDSLPTRWYFCDQKLLRVYKGGSLNLYETSPGGKNGGYHLARKEKSTGAGSSQSAPR